MSLKSPETEIIPFSPLFEASLAKYFETLAMLSERRRQKDIVPVEKLEFVQAENLRLHITIENPEEDLNPQGLYLEVDYEAAENRETEDEPPIYCRDFYIESNGDAKQRIDGSENSHARNLGEGEKYDLIDIIRNARPIIGSSEGDQGYLIILD